MREQTFALERQVDDETGAGITSSARRNLKLTPGNREGGGRRREEHQDAATLRGIGVQTPGERDAEERLKKKKSLDPSPLSAFEGLGVSFLRYSRG